MNAAELRQLEQLMLQLLDDGDLTSNRIAARLARPEWEVQPVIEGLASRDLIKRGPNGWQLATPNWRLRDALAVELVLHSANLGPRDPGHPDVWFSWCGCGWDGGRYGEGYRDRYHEHVADALLAVIRKNTGLPS